VLLALLLALQPRSLVGHLRQQHPCHQLYGSATANRSYQLLTKGVILEFAGAPRVLRTDMNDSCNLEPGQAAANAEPVLSSVK
jgi:hypothetical protein